MSGVVETQLREILAGLEHRLGQSGLLIGEVRVLDEGAWGRLDAIIEGPQSSGKLQIHLGKKGRVSVVPQGSAAGLISQALANSATGSAPPAARTLPSNFATAPVSKPRASAPIVTPPTVQRPMTSSVRGVNGELVVDCSKFGQHLIGPTQWRGMLREKGKWREVFLSPQFERGHNNLGEFLAIIDACQRVERGELGCESLWSDSQTALSWFRNGAMKTSIDWARDCDEQFASAIRDGMAWLRGTDRAKWTSLMSRWDVSSRGENPADFGRK